MALRPNPSDRWLRIVAPWLACLGLGLAGCVTTTGERAAITDLDSQLEVAGFSADEIVVPDRLTPEMVEWMHRRMSGADTMQERLRELLSALEYDKELDLEYEEGFTGTAAEVFESGKFNCLSFSHLFVGMARELGADAYYMRVNDIERYRREGDLVVVSGHVTAGYSHGGELEVLEFTVGPEVDYHKARPIPDITAIAMYYSNRGAELLRERKYEEARTWLATATRLDPSLSDAWINLGVVLRRTGDLDGAEAAYLKAVEAEPDALSAYHNLSGLYRVRGDEDAGREVLRLLDRRDNRNPFIYLALGDDSLALGHVDEAERFFRRALNLSTERAEARAAMGQVALAKGDIRQAREWLAKARRLDTENSRVIDLGRQLEETADDPPAP